MAPPAPSAHSPSARTLAGDRIARPAVHAPERPATATPLGPGDALPVLAAAALLSGGAMLAAPAVGAAVAGLTDTTSAVVAGLTDATSAAGDGLSRGAAFARTAGRAFGLAYHDGAQRAAGLDLGDAHAVGEMLGAQTWTATEELMRGAVVGAALAGGAQAAEGLSRAVGHALAPAAPHAAQR